MRVFTMCCATLLLWNLCFTLNADAFEEMEKAFDDQFAAADAAADEQFESMEAAWKEMERREEEAWKKMVAEVEARWNDQVVSTEKTWVDYNEDYESRSRVDFEEGKVTVEVLVPMEEEEPEEKAKEKVQVKIEAMYAEPDPETKKPLLEDLLEDEKGRKVDGENMEEFVKEEVVPKIKMEPKPVVGQDGVKRQKFTVELELIPEHLRVRVERYLPLVTLYAKRFELEPQLVLAIIHSESSFNPKAHSHAGAYGLMQLIPRYGARDAWRYLYKNDKVVDPEDLYVPENNIQLGTAYLYLLFNRYMRDIEHPTNKEYMVVCGYNWGAPLLRKKVKQKHDPNALEPDALYDVLMGIIPRETQGYLEKVTKRKGIYGMMFQPQ